MPIREDIIPDINEKYNWLKEILPVFWLDKH
jgi:hypothetical protein